MYHPGYCLGDYLSGDKPGDEMRSRTTSYRFIPIPIRTIPPTRHTTRWYYILHTLHSITVLDIPPVYSLPPLKRCSTGSPIGSRDRPDLLHHLVWMAPDRVRLEPRFEPVDPRCCGGRRATASRGRSDRVGADACERTRSRDDLARSERRRPDRRRRPSLSIAVEADRGTHQRIQGAGQDEVARAASAQHCRAPVELTPKATFTRSRPVLRSSASASGAPSAQKRRCGP